MPDHSDSYRDGMTEETVTPDLIRGLIITSRSKHRDQRKEYKSRKDVLRLSRSNALLKSVPNFLSYD